MHHPTSTASSIVDIRDETRRKVAHVLRGQNKRKHRPPPVALAWAHVQKQKRFQETNHRGAFLLVTFRRKGGSLAITAGRSLVWLGCADGRGHKGLPLRRISPQWEHFPAEKQETSAKWHAAHSQKSLVVGTRRVGLQSTGATVEKEDCATKVACERGLRPHSLCIPW